MSAAATIQQRLSERVRGEIRFGRHDRMLYSTDASIYQVEPLGVVIPADLEDAATAVGCCLEAGVPVLARGGGTALAGQTVNRAVVIDFSARCRGILALDATSRTATIEPGVVLDALNAAAAQCGLAFGPDVATSSHATLGGMIGNNSAGANSIVYGRTVEHLKAIDALLADGTRIRFDHGAAERDPRVRGITKRLAEIVLPLAAEIDRRFPKILRHVDGYNLDLLLAQLRSSTPGTFDEVNLAHLLCGAEGTLAVTLSAQVGLVERPKVKGLMIAAYRSVPEALEQLTTMLATGPSAVELVDDMVIAMAKRNRVHARDVALMPTPAHGELGAVMYIQYFAESREELGAKMDRLSAALPGVVMVRHVDPAAMEAAWRLRKAGEPLLHAVPGARKPITFVEDTAVDPAKLARFVEEFRRIVERHGTTAAYYAHASVGCLHIRPLVALASEQDLSVMRGIALDVADLVAKYEGALSGEHGDGRVRTPLLSRTLGPVLAKALRDVKAVFDPQGLLNPGNLVDNDDPTKITTKLRVRPDDDRFVHPPSTATFYRYEREEGFGHALEQCNGAGLCRRLGEGGTMCPSYRALKDERHTTRGRANALRLAVTGQLGSATAGRWDDSETQETLQLCLSCKACKAECPSNVDIAKLKAEYTAQGHLARGRVPWRSRAIANVRRLNRIGSALAPVSAWVARSPWGRSLIASVMGFAHERSLPEIAESLARTLARRSRARCEAQGPESLRDAPTVLLFGDCFSQFSEPEIGLAAVEVLEALGYRVILGDVGCCARAAISSGVLSEASRIAAATAHRLAALDEREAPVAILALEPSCLSAIKDDWQELRMAADPAMLARLAAKAFLVEEWIDAQWERHPRRVAFSPTSESVVLHAHCHQKALWGAESSSALLRRVFGARARTLPTGCCGMAGSFGLDAKTAGLSRQIAEGDLLPHLASAPHALVAACGASCRHQVRDLAGREAKHPIEIVRSALVDR